MNVLFLDYDGVVNTPMWQLTSTGKMRCLFNPPTDNKVNNFQACQWISEFCQRYNYKIVVTSTWRLFSDYRECLINGGLRDDVEIIGSTPDLRCTHDHACRGEEIREWLIEHHNEVDNFIIVDDEELGFDADEREYYADHFVLCDGTHGFGFTEMLKAEKIHKSMDQI